MENNFTKSISYSVYGVKLAGVGSHFDDGLEVIARV